jgi:NAD(P)-dependent dehydrogenase (short-subunit alcohol dehydrogenase family)
MRGRVVVITGGNSGIGKEAAVDLARMGATIVITSRSETKGVEAVEEVRRRSGSDAVAMLPLDLSSFDSIRTFSERQLTAEGYEMTFGANHLGHFLLTNLLLERLEASAPSRVVNVSSIAHRFGSISFADPMFEQRSYAGIDAYNQSKLANVLFTTELARRLAGTEVTANCLHPGAVRTRFGHADDTRGFERAVMVIGRPFMVSARRGSRTITYLASSPDVEGVSGQYFVRCRRHTPSKGAQDADAARRLWELSEQLVDAHPA